MAREFNLGSVAVRIVAKSSQFNRELSQADNKLRVLGRSAGKLARVGLASFAIGAGVAAKKTLDFNQAALDLSRQIDQPIDQLQALFRAGARVNVPLTEMVTTIRRIARRASDAATGNTELAKSFAFMNIDAEKFTKLDVVGQMLAMSRSIKELEGNTAKQSLQFKLLDIEGQRVVQLFKQGPAQILKWVDEARNVGAANRDAAVATDLLKRAMATVGDKIMGVVNQTAAGAARFFELEDGAKRSAAAALTNAQAQRVEAAAIGSSIDAQKKANLLRSGSSRTNAKQINRSTTFLSFAKRAASAPQDVKSKQLDETNKILGSILGAIRNTRTGATVVFQG